MFLFLSKFFRLFSHEHADAILGLDDIRVVQPFSATNEINLTPVYLAQDMNMTERYMCGHLFFPFSLDYSP